MVTLDEVEVIGTKEAQDIASKVASISKAHSTVTFPVNRRAPSFGPRYEALAKMAEAARSLVVYSKAEQYLIINEIPKAITDAQVALRMRPDLVLAKRSLQKLARDVDEKKRYFFGLERTTLESLGWSCIRASRNAGLMLEICDKSLVAAGIPIPEDVPIRARPPRMHVTKGRPRRPRPKPTR